MREERYGAPYWLVHRGDFHAVLVQALAERAPGAVRVGARCIGFEQDVGGVTLMLENGEKRARRRADRRRRRALAHPRGAVRRRPRHFHRLHGLARRRADAAPARDGFASSTA